ncbi:uncharacterized protein BT62DRAFT_262042 [Guyanagaster necrorhizus]|uniref:Uncharacterized protein n=1 Tax=Guyanagaster necrorhizus TaxID=856835 RepID=A0A9P8AZ83_9AGAR|nr:uncharacterized protein BT62DRAFT_999365 [Guyanagaster necrorhizus MCA 3950]XP_043045202.1 uncharacterized protein BT62DRAFT_262042 [Guyanagaster necrorhizus MCA 3950]KAG7451694.1 hypothetical protein BT62DRAFT_999365 [Guyanagaster necrorhizus MCA 3950]KAG7451702.1 hypothetical protein BT62DRAFT_262042 [Guyanagaster necrorhizus MCA 3950]
MSDRHWGRINRDPDRFKCTLWSSKQQGKLNTALLRRNAIEHDICVHHAADIALVTPRTEMQIRRFSGCV